MTKRVTLANDNVKEIGSKLRRKAGVPMGQAWPSGRLDR